MKKKLNAKLTLNRETLRQLSNRENAQVKGQGTRFCTGSDGCETIGAQCNTPACETVWSCDTCTC
jgi:hypothetical protein